MPPTKKTNPPSTVCPTCQGEGQIEDFLITGRGKTGTRIDTWAFCLDCCGTGQLVKPEGR
jgi:DnaJ-class molecular chaperone